MTAWERESGPWMAFGKAVRHQWGKAVPRQLQAHVGWAVPGSEQGTALGNHSSSSAGSGHCPEHPSVSPRFSCPMEEWRGTCLCTGHSGMCLLAAPHGHRGNVQEEQFQEAMCGHSVASPQATLHNSTLPIALKGLLAQAPTLRCLLWPLLSLQEEHTGGTSYMKFFLAEKDDHVLDISAVVGTRSPGPKVTHRAGSPWQHIQKNTA